MAKTTANDGSPEVRKKRAYHKKKKIQEQSHRSGLSKRFWPRLKIIEQMPLRSNRRQPAVAASPAADTPVNAAVASPRSLASPTNGEKQATDESTHDKYERIKRGNLHITDLQNLDVVELHGIARRRRHHATVWGWPSRS